MARFQTSMKPAVRLLTRSFSRKIFSPLMRNRTPVFMLHRLHNPANGVHGHTIDFIKAALAALRDSGAKFVSLRRLVETWRTGAPIDPNWIAFTIDDGFADQAILVKEAFAPMECPITVFLISGFLDSHLWPWDDQLSFALKTTKLQKADIVVEGRRFSLDLSSPDKSAKALEVVREHCKTIPNADPYTLVDEIASALGSSLPKEPPAWFQPMTWDTARALERGNLAEFGPHSMTHQIFSRMSDERAKLELEGSWSRLKKELSNPLSIFAWPTGRSEDFSNRDIQLAKELGFQGSVATDPDYAYHNTSDPDAVYRINRFSLPTDMNTVLRYGSWLERGRQLLPI